MPFDHSSRQSSDVHLTAENGTRIKTYGTKTLYLDFGLSRVFTWTFEMADVSCAIIGVDFLHYFGLLVDVRRHCLVDSTGDRTVACAVTSAVSVNAPLFADSRSRNWEELLREFPKVIRESPVPEVFLHGVEHVLQTTVPPLFARPRRLPPDWLGVARRDFDSMLEQGICRPSVSSWASPLLLVPIKYGSTVVITGDSTTSPFRSGIRCLSFMTSRRICLERPSSLNWTGFEPTTKCPSQPTTCTRSPSLRLFQISGDVFRAPQRGTNVPEVCKLNARGT